MRIMRWGVAAAAALTTSVPAVAEAATTTPEPASSAVAGHAVAPAVGAAPRVVASPSPAATSSAGTASPRVQSQGETVTQPAPAGSAQAYAARVGNIAAVSHTSASASGSGVSSTADPLELGGTPPAAYFGGTQNGPGSSHGALLDTGTTPLGRVAVTPWSVSNSSNSASGLADIVVVDLAPGGTPVASLDVLQSESNATWSPMASTGSSSSDGAILDVGGPSGLVVDVLHSQASSSGAGSSYLLSVNGNQIGTSSQANGQCALTVPSLLSLECLTASGGTGVLGSGGTTLTSAAGVASATLGPAGSALTAGLIQSASSSGRVAAATSPSQSAPAASPGLAPAPPEVGPASGAAPAAVAAPAAAVSSLPFTGANVILLVVAALLFGGAGTGLVLASRRRPRPSTR